MGTLSLDCNCCCPCDLGLARELHGTCTNPGDSDVTVSALDGLSAQDCTESLVCSPTCTHTFGADVALKYKRGRYLQFAADALVTCDGDDLAFAEWVLSGDVSCVENLFEWTAGGSGVYCQQNSTVKIQWCDSGTCPDITLTVHYAEPAVCPTLSAPCLDCYVDGENGTGDACEDTEGFDASYTSACA